METHGYSQFRCDTHGCKNNGTNDCVSCSRHFCDQHMLQTRLEGTHIGAITVEACASCTQRAVALYTGQGAYVSSWRRKAGGSR